MDDDIAGVVLQQKTDLFYVLVRLHQLMRDADLLTEDDILFAAEEGEDIADDEFDPELGPPTIFSDFLAGNETLIGNLANNYADEFANLFTILSAPLLLDPELKAEFLRYALETHGEEITFEPVVPESKKPQLTVVPTAPKEPDPPKTQ
jgi:hypothetical protein